jgi:hypothetical protein
LFFLQCLLYRKYHILTYTKFHTKVQEAFATIMILCYFIGFEVFTVVTMKNIVFWDVGPCRSCKINRRFGGTYRLHLQGRKIRELGTSMSRQQQMSVHFTGSTRRHIPEDFILLCYFVRKEHM